jgi:hypothetical protein
MTQRFLLLLLAWLLLSVFRYGPNGFYSTDQS